MVTKMMKGRLRVWAAGGILLAGMVLARLMASTGQPEENRVTRGDFVKHLVFQGEIQAPESISITAPRTRGFELTISYIIPDGSTVRAGDLLVEFDRTTIKTEKLENEKKLEEARVKIAQKEADLEMRRRSLMLELARAKKDLEVARINASVDVQLVPRSEWERYQHDLTQSELTLKKAEERQANLERTAASELAVVRLDYEQADLRLKQIQIEEDALSIRAPAGGLVMLETDWGSGRPYQIGDNTWPGQTLMELPYLENLCVRAQVHDVDSLLVPPDGMAAVILDCAPGRIFKGRLASMAGAAKSANFRSQQKTFSLQVNLLEPDTQLMKPGMTARVRVPVHRQDVLMVPRKALQIEGSGRVTVELDTDPVRSVPVTVVDANHGVAVIEGQVKEGDALLVNRVSVRDANPVDREWMVAKKQDLVFSIAGTGSLAAERAVDIGPPGLPDMWQYKIVRLVEEGVDVNPGDFLVAFDPMEVAKRLRDEQSELASVQEELRKSQAEKESQLKDMQLELEQFRNEKVKAETKLMEKKDYAAGNDVKKQELELAFARLQVEFTEQKLAAFRQMVELELGLLRGKVKYYQQRVQISQESMAKLEVKSTLSGVVIYNASWNNEKPQIGSQIFRSQKVLSIPDLDSQIVQGQIPEMDAGRIKPGQRVSLSLDAIPERVFGGKITRMGNTFIKKSHDSDLKVLEVEVRLDELDLKRMRPGMVARLQVEADRFQNVLAIPLSAVQQENGQKYIWIKQGKDVVKRPVTLGRDNGLVVIVNSGLAEKEEFAVQAQNPALAAR